MILNIFLLLVLLTAVTSIHEFGHLVAAKIFNVYCPEYSIGMGPLIFQKKWKETKYSIRALPIGGFVSMVGDSEETLDDAIKEFNITRERTVIGVSPIKRIVIMYAGIFMNFVLAILILTGIYLSIGVAYVSPEPIINSVVEGYPAQEAGLMANDYVKEIYFDNGLSAKPSTFAELSDFMSMYEGEGPIHFVVDRDGKEVSVAVTPVYEENEDVASSYVIGITSGVGEIVEIGLFGAIKHAFMYCKEVTTLIVTLLLGLFRGVGFNNMSGVVGMYKATESATAMGMESYVLLIALISLNVGLFNAIPLPLFDGGRVLLIFVEMITRRPIPKKIQDGLMAISVGLLALLFFFVTVQDIRKFF